MLGLACRFTLSLSSRRLGDGMTLAIFRALTVLTLALGCLPATNLTLATRILAVSLVPAEWLVALITPFAETNSRSSSNPSRTAPLQSILVLSYGSWFPLGPARGGS
jgi:hypothetical protein